MAPFKSEAGADPAPKASPGFPPLAGREVKSPTLSPRAMFVAGMFGPPVFLATILLGGMLDPGHSHLADPISELTAGGAPFAGALGALFVLAGLLNALTGYGLVLRYAGVNRVAEAAGLLIVAYAAIAMLLAGVVPQDPPGAQLSMVGIAHVVLVAVSALALVAAILLAGHAFSERRFFRAWSLATVALMLAGGAAVPFVVSADRPLLGLAELVTQIAYLQFLFVLALAEARAKTG